MSAASATLGLVALLLVPGLPLAFHLERRVHCPPGTTEAPPRDVLMIVALAAGATLAVVPTLTFLTGFAGVPFSTQQRALLSCIVLLIAGLVPLLLDARAGSIRRVPRTRRTGGAR